MILTYAEVPNPYIATLTSVKVAVITFGHLKSLSSAEIDSSLLATTIVVEVTNSPLIFPAL